MLTIRNLILCVAVPVALVLLLQRYPEQLNWVRIHTAGLGAAPSLRHG